MDTNTDRSDGFDKLMRAYRDACPEIEPSPNFMPNLWRKIEQRQSFWPTFEHLARTGVLAAAIVSLVLLVLNFAGAHPASAQSYIDALMADHTAEKTYYTEALRSTPPADEVPAAFQH
jgi:hypothetical protein